MLFFTLKDPLAHEIQVHALNTMREIIRDNKIIEDFDSSLTEQILMKTIELYQSEDWSVRNSATLAFTAFLQRVLGFRNPDKGDSKVIKTMIIRCALFSFSLPC